MLKKALAVFAVAVIAAGCASPDQGSPTVGPISPVSVTPAAAPSPSDTPSPSDPPTTQAPPSPPPPATTAAVAQGETGSGSGSGSGSNSGSCGADYYRNSDGVCVHRPVSAPGAPPGATAKCKDGTYSFSQHRQGTCSGHDGVAEWL
jgi:hypothetical protein